jgi:dTDP-4-dehydrorhamnose reductase
MKILLIGKNGQVGWELRRTLAPLAEVVAVDYPEINFSDPPALRQFVAATRPNVVVNAAAYTAVDKAETETELCRQVNAVAPGVLAGEAKKLGALMVHYSTDYIFDGTKTSPYVETDAPNPLGAYGRTKLEGDRAVKASGADHLIFRLCWVYGARGQNFMLTMQYHLAAGGQANWHEFASRIIELMPEAEQKCRAVEKITTPEYPTPAKRPPYSVLDCGKLQKTFGLRLPDWETSLRQVLDKP